MRPGSPRPSRQGRTPSPGTRPSIPYGARSRPSSGTASCARTHSRTSRSADTISRTSTRPFARTRGVAGRGGIPPRRGCDDSWSSSTTRRCFARAKRRRERAGGKFARWRGGSIPRSHARGQPTRAPKRRVHTRREGIQKNTHKAGSDAEATAEGALWIYRVAFDELTRQVSSQCRDRGALLAKVWDHFFSIVEMRAGLRYEGLVTEARERALATSRDLEQSRAETDALNTRLQELDETLARTRTLRHRDQTTHDMTVLGMEVKARDAVRNSKIAPRRHRGTRSRSSRLAGT